MTIRSLRISSEIKKILAIKLLKMPAFLTILDVNLTHDLSTAKIYFSLFGNAAQCRQTLEILEQEKKLLRMEIGRKLKQRIVPELVWLIDKSLSRADKICQLLK